jgi:RNA polymerase sigma factor (sigma-70 family)
MDSRTDSQLVYAARAGDKAAFGVLIERYTPMVRGIARRRLGSEDSARDMMQEAFLQAFLSLDQLRSARRFKSWLYGITLNVCRVYWRGQREYSLDDMLGGAYREPAVYGPTPEEIAERRELRRMVTSAVAKLSPANRAAILLFYYEGLSLGEAAATLDISVTALKGRLHKARRRLHAALNASFVDEMNANKGFKPLAQGQYTLEVDFDEGENRMIPVKLIDVYRKEAEHENAPPEIHMQIVLYDEAGQRAIIIWIGEYEGMAIARHLLGIETLRPLGHIFMARLLKAAGMTLESVEISALANDVFYATAHVRGREAVDARPSDALALALQLDTPIFVAEEVIDAIGMAIPANHKPNAKGLAAIRAHIDEVAAAQQAASESPDAPKPDPKQAAQPIIEAAFS